MKGIIAADRRAYEAKFDLAWPQIRKQIRNGNTGNAIAAIDELKVTPQQKRLLLRAAGAAG